MLTLPRGEVQVWLVSLRVSGTQLDELDSALSEDEAQRAGRFRFERDRQCFVACRGVLRTLLGSYLGKPARRVEFCYGQNRKPRLAGATSPYFNVSHSGGSALFAFTPDCELGADLESVRPLPDLDRVAERFFSTAEHEELASLPADQRERAFFLCWTRKEAYIKATGEGLSAPLDQFRVTLRPESVPRFVHINRDIVEAAAWTLHNIDAGASQAAAIAYRNAPLSVRVMDQLAAGDLLESLRYIGTNGIG